MKVEMDVLAELPPPSSPYGLCGRKATLKQIQTSELGSRVKVEVDVLAELPPPSLKVRTVSVDVNQR